MKRRGLWNHVCSQQLRCGNVPWQWIIVHCDFFSTTAYTVKDRSTIVLTAPTYVEGKSPSRHYSAAGFQKRPQITVTGTTTMWVVFREGCAQVHWESNCRRAGTVSRIVCMLTGIFLIKIPHVVDGNLLSPVSLPYPTSCGLMLLQISGLRLPVHPISPA